MTSFVLEDPHIASSLIKLREQRPPEVCTRVIVITLGEFGKKVHETWDRLYSAQWNLSPVQQMHQWVHVDNVDQCKSHLMEAYGRLANVQKIQELRQQGFKIDLNRDQLVVLYGIHDDGVKDIVQTFLKEFKDFCAEVDNPAATFTKIMVLSLDSPEHSEENQNEYEEVIASVGEGFSRTYFIETKGEGIYISSKEGLFIVASQFVNFLKLFPSVANQDSFDVWRTGIRDAPFCGFNVLTMAYPYMEIAEYLLIKEGTELVEKALLPKTEVVEADIVTLTHLIDENVIRMKLRSFAQKVKEPIDFTQGSWEKIKREELLDKIELLKGITDKLIRDQNPILYEKNSQGIVEEFESISNNVKHKFLSEELGGTWKAKSLFEICGKLLKDFSLKGLSPKSTEYFMEAEEELKQILGDSPNGKSISLRWFFLGLILAIPVFWSDWSFTHRTIWTIGSFVLSALCAYTHYRYIREKISSARDKILLSLSAIFSDAMRSLEDNYIQKIIDALSGICRENEEKMSNLYERLTSLSENFRGLIVETKDNYNWINVVELQKYLDFTQLYRVDLEKDTLDFVRIDRPLDSWEGFESEKDAAMNSFEKDILIKAARRIVPYLKPVAQKTVFDYVHKGNKNYDNYLKIMKESRSPFLRIIPECIRSSNSCYIVAEQRNSACQQESSCIAEDLTTHQTHTGVLSHDDPHTLIFVSLVDGLCADHITFFLKKQGGNLQ